MGSRELINALMTFHLFIDIVDLINFVVPINPVSKTLSINELKR